jgi:hypothetical protein
MTSEEIWFYESGGEQRGPVSATALLELRRGGSIGADNLVWREGLAGWIPFAESELASITAASPAPPSANGPLPPPVPRGIGVFTPRPVPLRPDFSVSIQGCYGRAWTLLASRFWPFVGCFTLVMLILSVASQLVLPALFLVFPLYGGFSWYTLRLLRGKEANVDMIFEGFRRQFGPLAIANLIVSGIALGLSLAFAAIIVAILVGVSAATGPMGGALQDEPAFAVALFGGATLGTLVLVLPLMMLQAVGGFATLLILDGALEAGPALGLAWQATKRHLGKIVLFMFLNGLLTAVGMIACYVGVLVTGAWAAIAVVCLYEDAFGEGPSAQGSPR